MPTEASSSGSGILETNSSRADPSPSSSIPSLPLSILSSSPPRTLSPTSPASSTASLSTLTVKFAPLPALAPRKRRSMTPLGVAARSQLVSRRRRFVDAPPTHNYHHHPRAQSEMWADTPGGGRVRVLRPRLDEELMEDPFAALGRAVRGLWRRVANKDGKGVLEEDEEGVEEVDAQLSGEGQGVENGEEQGRVWEEEVSLEFRRRVDQTQTIGGRARYSWAGEDFIPPPPATAVAT